MHNATMNYRDGEHELQGYVSYSERDDKPKPAVLVIHDWSGQNSFFRQKADVFAELGYVGFAVDMYGLGQTATSAQDKQTLVNPLIHDRLLLRTRIQAAYDTVAAMPEVDKKNIAVVGFSFGGLCALDLARSGAALKGAISVHGLLDKPTNLACQPIQSKILALHGAEDPLVPTSTVEAFCQEMNAGQVDWQLHVFGQTKHAFTNPHAHDTSLGMIYSAQAARRSTQLISVFLEDVFG